MIQPKKEAWFSYAAQSGEWPAWLGNSGFSSHIENPSCCFGKETEVLVGVDERGFVYRRISELNAGDSIVTVNMESRIVKMDSRVRLVLENHGENGLLRMRPAGQAVEPGKEGKNIVNCTVTPYHPILVSGSREVAEWIWPETGAGKAVTSHLTIDAEKVKLDEWYNLVLDSNHVMFARVNSTENGAISAVSRGDLGQALLSSQDLVPTCTLGHGLKGKVIGHRTFGVMTAVEEWLKGRLGLSTTEELYSAENGRWVFLPGSQRFVDWEEWEKEKYPEAYAKFCGAEWLKNEL